MTFVIYRFRVHFPTRIHPPLLPILSPPPALPSETTTRRQAAANVLQALTRMYGYGAAAIVDLTDFGHKFHDGKYSMRLRLPMKMKD
jgi:hypothetical protein